MTRTSACGNCDGIGILDGKRDEWGFGLPCPLCDGLGMSRHECCWHERTLLNEHTDGIVNYRQCCRCDLTPEEVGGGELR